MILGEPTFQTLIDLIEDEGCPHCGEDPAEIQVHGPNKIVLKCGHVVDAETWINVNE